MKTLLTILGMAEISASGTVPEVMNLNMGAGAEQSTYMLATVLMDFVHWIMSLIGLGSNSTLFIWLYSAVVFAVAFFAGIIVKWIMVKILHKIGPHIKSDIYQNLIGRRFFTKTCRIIPALLFIILIQFTLYSRQSLASWLSRVSWIYVVLILIVSLTTLADVLWNHINNRANKKRLPLNGVVQLVKLILWVIGAIVIVAIILGKSPASLFAGLGAFSAVLMLVFKDNIMGVVAGIQLAENDSLHEGDWIVPNGGSANGIVVGVGLTAIKIENWDKTVSTIPPYSLISNGFKNYRNMQVSQTREIKRSYLIDADSVVPTDDDMIAEFSKLPIMKDWIARKLDQRSRGKEEDVNNSEGLVDGSLDSNLGIFRAYVKLWLDSNPSVSHADTCFVNTLEQTPTGIPLQVYCFSSTSSWVPYEGIQSSIFEHIAVMLYKFRLYVYESASGRDTLIDGFLSAGKSTQAVFGFPYPFYYESGSPMAPSVPPAGVYPNAPASVTNGTGSGTNTPASKPL